MPLSFTTNKSIDDIYMEIASAFPELKISRKFNSTLYVRNERINVIVRLKKDLVTVGGGFNFKDPVIIFFICLGILLTIVGIILIFIILYMVYRNKIDSFKQEIFNTISE